MNLQIKYEKYKKKPLIWICLVCFAFPEINSLNVIDHDSLQLESNEKRFPFLTFLKFKTYQDIHTIGFSLMASKKSNKKHCRLPQSSDITCSRSSLLSRRQRDRNETVEEAFSKQLALLRTNTSLDQSTDSSNYEPSLFRPDTAANKNGAERFSIFT